MFDGGKVIIGFAHSHKRLSMFANAPLFIAIISIGLIYGRATNLHAQPKPQFHEYQIKAAFLYNFARFVNWPEEAFAGPDTPISIGILGNDPFGIHLDLTLRDKTVKGRNLVVKRFTKLDDTKLCHILFISKSEKGRVSETLSVLKNWHVLTASDMKGFAQCGGVIAFVTKDNKIGFEINVDSADQAGLKISSKLLKLAKIVRRNH
jgi:hypothetical protein